MGRHSRGIMKEGGWRFGIGDLGIEVGLANFGVDVMAGAVDMGDYAIRGGSEDKCNLMNQ